MDVLSDVVTAMRIGRPHASRVLRGAPSGRRFDAFAGVGFHVVLQGTCWLFPSTGEPIMMSPGEIAFLPTGCAHGIADSPATPLATWDSLTDIQSELDGPVVMLCGAYFTDSARWHPLLNELPDIVHLPARPGRHPALRTAIDLLDDELSATRPGSDAMVPALLDVVLLHMLRAWFGELAATRRTGWAAALHDPAISAALHAIHDTPNTQWTVKSLAGRAGLSRAAFARRFTALVGQPPLTYLTWWRMTVAARLLRETDLPLAAVARQVGYASEFAFAHAFKREHGEAPGRFRTGHNRVTAPAPAGSDRRSSRTTAE